MPAVTETSAMAEHVRGVVSREMDTDALFEKYDIEEIREIEKKTRQDIERKKEELRVMVGERYRELIEAADTISEMKTCAQDVVKSINCIQDMCQDLKQTFQAKTFASLSTKAKQDVQGKPEENHFYSMASQIKLLMDMPEKIWSAIDVGQYLQATQLFLLAKYAYNSLQLGSHDASKVHTWFPVLIRQWAAISHFRGTILQTCRHVLMDVNIPDQKTAECLAAVLLLEESTPRQVFNEFLLVRSSAINQLFQSDSTVSVKTQICGVVKTIVTTVHQIYTVFYDGRHFDIPCNLLMNILSDVTNKGEKGIILPKPETSISAKYLSKRIFDYRPQLQQHATAIQVSNLQENCLQWIDTCRNSVKSGLGKLLAFINTVKALASIRDEVWQLLKQDENMTTWDSVCEQIAKRPINVWNEFFREHFINRAEALLQTHFDSVLSLCTQQVAVVLNQIGNPDDRTMEYEHNLANYIWTESGQDIPTNMAWIPLGSKTLLDGGDLMMKARAYTPAVQCLSRILDSKIKGMLDDSSHYLKPPEEGTTGASPFDCSADRDEIKRFIEGACEDCVKKLIEQLKQQLSDSEKQLDSLSADPSSCKIVIDKVLLLGRFCIALCELSPHLQQCMMSASDKPVERPVKKTRVQQKTPDNPKWTALKDQLLQFGHEAYNLWTNYMAKKLIEQFRSFLLDKSTQSLLRNCTKWDEIQIEEETEDGEKIKSTIQVPMQMSWYLQSLLYDLCEEINRIGGHALPRPPLMLLVDILTDGVIEAYEEFLDSCNGKEQNKLWLTQNRALQLMYDLKAFMNLLPRKEEKETNRIYQQRGQKIIERLEGYVDPFDLDVFSPHIQQHLIKQTQRSNILFGALTSLDHHIPYVYGGKQSSVQHEQHNVLPLTTTTGRFPLLPLSIQHRPPMPHPILQSPKPLNKGSPLISPSSLGPSSPPPLLSPTRNEQSTQSFFGQMSTIWFSNVGKNK